jgi:hypothetical protein
VRPEGLGNLIAATIMISDNDRNSTGLSHEHSTGLSHQCVIFEGSKDTCQVYMGNID